MRALESIPGSAEDLLADPLDDEPLDLGRLRRLRAKPGERGESEDAMDETDRVATIKFEIRNAIAATAHQTLLRAGDAAELLVDEIGHRLTSAARPGDG